MIMYLRSGTRDFEFDNAATSFSVPVRRGSRNGTAAVTLGAKANTEGFTAVYDGAMKQWTLTGTGGGKPAVSEAKKGALPAGTTWTVAIPDVVTVVITQSAAPEFANGDAFKFSVFKTTAPNGKQFEIDKGPIDPLAGP